MQNKIKSQYKQNDIMLSKNSDPDGHQQNQTTVYALLHRKSYMSVHVLLNLLNKMRKRDKIRGLQSILSLFRNEFNKYNNTRA